MHPTVQGQSLLTLKLSRNDISSTSAEVEGEEVEEEKDRVLPERVMWYPHEDSFVG